MLYDVVPKYGIYSTMFTSQRTKLSLGCKHLILLRYTVLFLLVTGTEVFLVFQKGTLYDRLANIRSSQVR